MHSIVPSPPNLNQTDRKGPGQRGFGSDRWDGRRRELSHLSEPSERDAGSAGGANDHHRRWSASLFRTGVIQISGPNSSGTAQPESAATETNNGHATRSSDARSGASGYL